MKFSELGLTSNIISSLEDIGFKEATPIQEVVIPEIIKGRDVIGSAQTGTGKTAAFALPILHLLKNNPTIANKRVRSLIIGPTRELAAQITDQFKLFGKTCDQNVCLLHGGVSYKNQNECLALGADIVIATPGRLLDHAKNKTINLSSVEIIVLDEVDRMLVMGFVDDVLKIMKLCSHKKRQTLLFSATIPNSLNYIIKKHLNNPFQINIGVELSPSKTINHVVYPIGALQKFDLLISLIEEKTEGNMIIFCRMKTGADRIARWLKASSHRCAVMHSNLSQKVREKALEDFKREKVRILVATDIASRGLDIASVMHVINYDVPLNNEDYVHRIGRTGRAQREGDAATLVALDEVPHIESIEKFINQPIPQKKLEGFCYSNEPNIRKEAIGNVRRRRNSKSSQFGRRRM